MSLLGYQWLVDHYDLPKQPLPVESVLGTRTSESIRPDGSVKRIYQSQYKPTGDDLAGHLEFALKHEGVHLAVLSDLFSRCGASPIEAMIEAKPTGRYARLVGFYYEWFTGLQLSISNNVGGNYIDALNSTHYWTADSGRRNPRWRVRDNLLGNAQYCPTVRRSTLLVEALDISLDVEIDGLIRDFPPELFARANEYLYLKETRSTYSIERESMPENMRRERFVTLLREAGEGALRDLLGEESLRQRQNLIVEPRYAAQGFRVDQSYVGEQRPDFSQRIHYICPPPDWVHSMMEGLSYGAENSAGLPPVVRAAMIAFGFVFIHPFDDGNGRLHRFLIHDVLHRGGLVKTGLMLPVSATMLRLIGDYDKALEDYSRPLMSERVEYTVDDDGRLTLSNPEQATSYFRYPDLTRQAEYLARTVVITIREDIAEELRFLRNYDKARIALQTVVDMPDRRCDNLLRCLHQNHGELSKTKRTHFSELSEDEIIQIETSFSEAFQMGEF